MGIIVLAIILIGGLFIIDRSNNDKIPINILEKKIKSEVKKDFVNGIKVVVHLEADKTARIKQGTENFGIAIGAKTIDGTLAGESMKYNLQIDESGRDSCYNLIGIDRIKNFFKLTPDSDHDFNSYEDDTAFGIIQLNVPNETVPCLQRIFLEVKDGNQTVGKTFFVIEVTK